MGQSPLGHLAEHGEGGLLDRLAQGMYVGPLPVLGQRCREDPRERYVHALDGVWEVDQSDRRWVHHLSLGVEGYPSGELLDLGTGREGETGLPSELVQHVPDPYVERLAEDPIPTLDVGNDLSVPSRGVKQNWVRATQKP